MSRGFFMADINRGVVVCAYPLSYIYSLSKDVFNEPQPQLDVPASLQDPILHDSSHRLLKNSILTALATALGRVVRCWDEEGAVTAVDTGHDPLMALQAMLTPRHMRGPMPNGEK